MSLLFNLTQYTDIQYVDMVLSIINFTIHTLIFVRHLSLPQHHHPVEIQAIVITELQPTDIQSSF